MTRALVCLACHKISTHGSRCGPCQEARDAAFRARLDESRKRNQKVRLREYRGDWPRISRQTIAAQPWCVKCMAETDLTVDHIVPLSEGGTHDAGNLRVLCRRCNARRAWPGRKG